VRVGEIVIEGPVVGVLVKVFVGLGTQNMPVYTELENEGGGGSSESMPAVFVMFCGHAPAMPHHDTACTPPHVLPTFQFTTVPGFEHAVPPLQPE
jgi:hypothetical protein